MELNKQQQQHLQKLAEYFETSKATIILVARRLFERGIQDPEVEQIEEELQKIRQEEGASRTLFRDTEEIVNRIDSVVDKERVAQLTNIAEHLSCSKTDFLVALMRLSRRGAEPATLEIVREELKTMQKEREENAFLYSDAAFRRELDKHFKEGM